MKTRVSSATKEVLISDDQPTVLIGERINPTGKKKLAAALQAGDMELVRSEAIAQVQAGVDILDVNVGAPGIDETILLPQAVQAIIKATSAVATESISTSTVNIIPTPLFFSLPSSSPLL